MAETDDVDNPTFLSVTPDGSLVHANSEVFAWREGTVSAYRFDRQTATLSYINKQPALGGITAHNTITRDGAKLLLANYGFLLIDTGRSIEVGTPMCVKIVP
ncbi:MULTISPECIES: beta-propeller fold lactonase family protein [unclassified Mesorhizobium]|uniref:beta-propeller fold lactonase family protein n=1 Tax=unclassified Mesorhizobium TaxID=325217 RepID=UPI001FDF1DC8|nr:MULTISPECIES: beta-propeller fold lactonase family protein [unclassified Mesorhizobium]